MREQIIDRDYAIKEILVDDFQILHTGEIITTKGQKVPNEEEIQAKLKELQDEYEKQAYARSRQSEYPDLQECIHALLDGGDTLTELQTKRSEIKQKFPKPT